MTSALARRGDLVQPAPGVDVLPSPLPVWGLLFLNVLTYIPLPSLVPIPASVGQVITQGALPVALLLALLANRSVVVRPNLLMVLLTTLAVVSLMVSIHNDFLIGSTYRACRLLAFVAVLWLLTRWWGRSDLVLLRSHVSCLRVVVGSILLGALLVPGKAFDVNSGRLGGALWPIPPTQAGHYAAVLVGVSAVMWFAGAMRGRSALLTLVAGAIVLVGAHTRTALLALVVGVAVAGASLFLGHARVRRTSAVIGVVSVVGGALFAPLIMGWLWRGQTLADAQQLTGRTKVWSMISAVQRPLAQQAFGSGLSNKSFNGLPIDSNWLSVYVDQGWFGVVVDASVLLMLVLLAVTSQRGLRRALALFLAAYCLVASFTETGLGDASPYLLEVFLAGSLLAAPVLARPAGRAVR